MVQYYLLRRYSLFVDVRRRVNSVLTWYLTDGLRALTYFGSVRNWSNFPRRRRLVCLVAQTCYWRSSKPQWALRKYYEAYL